MPIRRIFTATICVIWSFSLLGVTLNIAVVQAAERQGGGLFKTAPVKKQKSSRSRKKSKSRKKSRPVSSHNYNGKYEIDMNLLSNSSSNPCYSGSKNFEVRNNSAALKTWAFGDTIGGRVSGGTMVLFGQNSGVLTKSSKNPWNWSGQIRLPKSRSVIGTGSLKGIDKNGKGCRWKAEVRKL